MVPISINNTRPVKMVKKPRNFFQEIIEKVFFDPNIGYFEFYNPPNITKCIESKVYNQSEVNIQLLCDL
jgi:hypothetical protein